MVLFNGRENNDRLLQSTSAQVAAGSCGVMMVLAFLLGKGHLPAEALPVILVAMAVAGLSGAYHSSRLVRNRKIATQLALWPLVGFLLLCALGWIIGGPEASALTEKFLIETTAGILLGALFAEDALFWMRERQVPAAEQPSGWPSI